MFTTSGIRNCVLELDEPEPCRPSSARAPACIRFLPRVRAYPGGPRFPLTWLGLGWGQAGCDCDSHPIREKEREFIKNQALLAGLS